MEKKVEKIINIFKEYSKIPHPSLNTTLMQDYFISYAKSHNYDFKKDNYGNIYFDVEATDNTLENVILQAHFDMVCVKTSKNEIDFNKDGIEVLIKGDKLVANNTSLGADNGIGIAIILAILEENIKHGKIRVLLTNDEEIGLVGASKLDSSWFDGFKYLINTDYEEVNRICYGNAGNLRVEYTKKIDFINNDNKIGYRLSLDNLIGGHSGMDINKNRLNAIKVLFNFINLLVSNHIEVNLVSFNIGNKINAIAFFGYIEFSINNKDIEKLNSIYANYFTDIKLKNPKENITFELTRININKYVSLDTSNEIINLIFNIPSKVISYKRNEVITSNNIGICSLIDNKVIINTSSRSCIDNDLDNLELKFNDLAKQYSFDFKVINKYPGWLSLTNTKLIMLAKKAYEETSNIIPTLETIHAGFECSWFKYKSNNIQMIAIGPCIHNPHSTSEYLEIKSIKPTFNALKYIIENLK